MYKYTILWMNVVVEHSTQYLCLLMDACVCVILFLNVGWNPCFQHLIIFPLWHDLGLKRMLAQTSSCWWEQHGTKQSKKPASKRFTTKMIVDLMRYWRCMWEVVWTGKRKGSKNHCNLLLWASIQTLIDDVVDIKWSHGKKKKKENMSMLHWTGHA
jgi:hypothetical protein